ncbi:MAG: hypothetical protein WCY82_08445 [Desulfotomaculaceae bacterium]
MPDDITKTQSYMPYPQETLDAMYPDIYYRCYPMVKQACEMYDNPNNPDFYPYPNRTSVNQMADYVYQRVATTEGYYPMNRQDGSGNILRSLILILIIRELLRRRGSF